MISILRASFRRPKVTVLHATPRLALTEQSVRELNAALVSARTRNHEGVAYLFGLTAEGTTLCVTAFAPKAETGPGHFFVSKEAMMATIRAATAHGLSVVGQAHTHPGSAYHSEGDITGLHISYPGFVSIVLPDYGAQLPSFEGADILAFGREKRWTQLASEDLLFVRERQV